MSDSNYALTTIGRYSQHAFVRSLPVYNRLKRTDAALIKIYGGFGGRHAESTGDRVASTMTTTAELPVPASILCLQDAMKAPAVLPLYKRV